MSIEIVPCLTTPQVHSSVAAELSGQTNGSFELKFLMADVAADEILKRARMQLAPDPNADNGVGDCYRVSNLYFDTHDLAVYRGVGSFGRRKFRLRRYGAESHVFLERKAKLNGLVRKRRSRIPGSELAILLHSAPEQPTWPGHWFHRRLVARRLAPNCQIAYDRVARVGMTPEGPIRLTVDRRIRCRPAAGLHLPNLIEGATILAGQSIVEFKFRVAMPALFKNWLHELALIPTGVSKYRMSVDACGLNSLNREPQACADVPDDVPFPRTPADCS